MNRYPVLDEIARVQERNCKDYEELARITGQTIAEIEADTCAPDPCPENPCDLCTEYRGIAFCWHCNVINPPAVARALTVFLEHIQRRNSAKRQICCHTCHTCGGELREVLDGELWCDTCEAHR